MYDLNKAGEEFLSACREKGLSAPTLKMYGVCVRGFCSFARENGEEINGETVKVYLSDLKTRYKQSTINQRMAVVSLFLDFLKEKGELPDNPVSDIGFHQIKQDSTTKAVPLNTVQEILKCAYAKKATGCGSEYAYRKTVKDIAVMELLFATGMRLSELCNLKGEDIDLEEKVVHVRGKTKSQVKRNRTIQLVSEEALGALREYVMLYADEIKDAGFFFINRDGRALSGQSVRILLRQYAEDEELKEMLTPKVLRDTFVTSLLAEDVSLVSAQNLLGHRSIVVTKRYAKAKMSGISPAKFPRNKIEV